MNSIIYYIIKNYINGSIIDAFEYFITAFEYNPKLNFILISPVKISIDFFVNIINNRYDLNPGWEKNIILIKLPELLQYKFNKVLVLDYWTIKNTRGLIRCNELIVISEKHTDDSHYMYSKLYTNVTYYGEMPFEYRDEKYNIKLMFSKFKKLNNVDSGIYINSPYNDDYSFLEKLNLPDKPLLFKSDNHIENLFEKFDTYVYYHANKWFDPHPRLLLECAYYNKTILYYNEHNIIDGSYYRYHDLLKNGLKNRYLNKNDKIIRKLI
jgi:hypothetical protein